MLIALDTGPLGDLINPNSTADAVAMRTWMASHLANGVRFLLPELADFPNRIDCGTDMFAVWYPAFD